MNKLIRQKHWQPLVPAWQVRTLKRKSYGGSHVLKKLIGKTLLKSCYTLRDLKYCNQNYNLEVKEKSG